MIQDLRYKEASLVNKIGISLDFVRIFFSWWYGDIPVMMLAKLKRTLIVVNDITSFGIILKGFFRPWKNDYNIAGWLVGMIIKMLYLPIILSILLIIVLVYIAILAVQLMILPVIIGLILVNPFLTP